MKKEEKATTNAKDVQWENVKPTQPEEQPAPKNNTMLFVGGGLLLLLVIGGLFFYGGSSNTTAEEVQKTDTSTFWKDTKEKGIKFAKDHPYATAAGVFIASIFTGKAVRYVLHKFDATRPVVDWWAKYFDTAKLSPAKTS